jgi:hypothetical protein
MLRISGRLINFFFIAHKVGPTNKSNYDNESWYLQPNQELLAPLYDYPTLFTEGPGAMDTADAINRSLHPQYSL